MKNIEAFNLEWSPPSIVQEAKQVPEAVKNQLLSLWKSDNRDSAKLSNHLVTTIPGAQAFMRKWLSDRVVELSCGHIDTGFNMIHFMVDYPTHMDGFGMPNAIQLLLETQATGEFFQDLYVRCACKRTSVMITYLLGIKEEILYPGIKQVSQVPELRAEYLKGFPPMSELDWEALMRQLKARHPQFKHSYF